MNSAIKIWEAVLGELQVNVSKPNYDTWLKDTRGLTYEANRLTVGVPSNFVGEWIGRHLQSLVAKVVVKVLGANTEVIFSVSNTRYIASPSPVPRQQTDGGTSQLLERPTGCLCKQYTFESFITGKSNRMAFSAANQVIDDSGGAYGLLFLYSGTGLGKTHLLHAIAHAAKIKEINTICVTAEQFTNELVKAIKEERMEEFQERYRNSRLLLMDDVQFLSGKKKIQDTFLHIFDDLHSRNARIVLTADTRPRMIPQLDAKLQSRFTSGIAAEIQVPDSETRLSILKLRAQEKGLPIELDVLEFLAARLKDGVRELEGVLNCLCAYAHVTKAPLTLELASQVLDTVASSTSHCPSSRVIKQAVADSFTTTPDDMCGKKKDRNTSLARQVAMLLLKEDGRLSLTQIGQEFGNRNHSTVLYNCRKIAAELGTDSRLKNQVADIRKAIQRSRA